jgi:hypothetical protein
MLDQQRDVLAALSQRRQLHRDDVQPVVKIFAKRAVRNHLRKVGMRRGDHADVNLDCVRITNPLELTFLQHAQQLGLKRGTHRSDFVEKQRALVRLLEPPLPRADRTGKRTAYVAEELGFEQRFRNRAAVQRDEAVRAPRTVVMDGASRQFLAGTGLAGDQNGTGRCRNCFEQLKKLAHNAAAANESVNAIPIFELRSQVCVFRFESTLFERGAKDMQQRVELERLGDEVSSPPLDRLDGVFHRSIPGDDDRDDLGVTLERRLDHLGAVDPWQTQIGDQNVEGKIRETLKRFLAASRLFDDEPVIGEALGDRLAQRGLIIDDQQMFLALSHLVRVGGILTPADQPVNSSTTSAL